MSIPQLSDRALDSRARRAARSAGFVARKSRRHRYSLDNAGEFMLLNPENRFVVAGSRYDMTADEVIAWCKAD